MPDQTRRFGLTIFDTPSDELRAQNYRFTDGDRLLLDRLLRIAVEDHVHTGATATATAPAAPGLAVGRTGGAIPANVAVHYRYSIIDARGQETIASATATVNTPVPASAPAYAPRLSKEYGILEAGEYHYAVSACTHESVQETLVGPLATATLSDFGGWRLDLPPQPSGSEFFNVYRKGPRESELTYWTTTTPDQRYIVDDGYLKTTALRRAPVANTTNMTNSIWVTLPEPLPTGSWTWKLYRTFDAANWENSLLQWNGADSQFQDDGRATQAGFPPGSSMAVGGAPKIDLGREAQGTPPPSTMNAAVRTVNLHANRIVEGAVGTWFWCCDYNRAELLSIRATVRKDAPPLRQIQVGLDIDNSDATYNLTWWWSLTDMQARPVVATIEPGETVGPPTSLVGLHYLLSPGNKIRLHIWKDGYDELPLDQIHDLTLVVTMMVRGEGDQTYIWETS